MKKYDHLSENEQIDLVLEFPFAIREISNPSTNIMKAAIKEDPNVFYNIENPPSEIIEFIIKDDPYFIGKIYLTEDIQYRLIEQCDELPILKIFLRTFRHKFDMNALETLKNKIAILEVMGS